ncbi:MAG TPA: radical SAM protein [Candidatus Saccharimonadales bacterium]|nr:radical SAM protein [Candidatus Saccharimonadales bacterium]
MRVALAYPYTKGVDHQCFPPLALMYLGTSLRDRGTEVQIFDQDGFAGGRRELLDRVVDYRPDLVGVPSFSELPFLRGLRDFSREIRARLPRATLLVGGPHATACPEETLDQFPEVDLVLCGEADDSLPELVDQLRHNAAEPQVPGLCYHRNGDPVRIPPGRAPRDLDAIPIPDRRMLWDNYRRGVYWRVGRRPPADMLITSRGCPFRCNFCFKVEPGCRFRGAQNVVAELCHLASQGITTVDFEDDLFTARKDRCLEICRQIREAGLKLDLKVRSHVRTIDEEMLREMKQVGVRAVVYGIESGSQPVLDAMNKKATVADNYRAVRLTKKAGMMCFADVFVGYPGETRETIAETRKFLRTARPTAVNVGALIPYPGTHVYREARDHGTLLGAWGPDGPQPFVRLPWVDDPRVMWSCATGLVRAFYTHPLVALAILRRIVFRADARQWRGVIRYARRRLWH